MNSKAICLAVNLSVLLSFLFYSHSYAQNVVNLSAPALIPKAALFPLPGNATFLEGSTFDVPIFLDTRGNSVNTVELHIKFDSSKLSIIRPSGDKSIIAVWLEPPTYSNTNGTAKLVGVIPNGIITESGLIATITFKALVPGQGTVSIAQNSRVLLNDGLGTEALPEFGRGVYAITPKAPEGPKVFSETHPFQDKWYNNPNPVLAWDKEQGVTAFSYILDDKPFTIPDNDSEGEDTSKGYENLPDGLWYFHIKALKRGIWGAATHFLVRIDTSPPAEFTPTFEILGTQDANRVLISFFTTDALSGINHFEVGVIEKSQPPTESPVFIQAESPYQLPRIITSDLRVIARVIDNAGNVRDEPLDIVIKAPSPPPKRLADYAIQILIGSLALILLLFILHYLIGHKVIAHMREGLRLAKEEEKRNKTRLAKLKPGEGIR